MSNRSIFIAYYAILQKSDSPHSCARGQDMTATAFFAFPAEPPIVRLTIEEVVPRLGAENQITVVPWPRLNIIGLKIDNLIRDRISALDFLAADITYPNFNVYYEIGYAIGRGKFFIPTVNIAVASSSQNARLTGLFDTIGWGRYQNSDQLMNCLRSWDGYAWTNTYRKATDHTQPLFILDTSAKTDFRNFIVQTVANTSVKYRSFDPVEVPRLSMPQAVGDVTSSAGVIIPIISTDLVDAERHNLRAAMLAGLCHGYGIEPLIIQYEDQPAPLDFRDFIETTRTRREVEQEVEEYCQATLIRNQQRSSVDSRTRTSILQKIDIGASAAENEFQKLERYFIRTAEFSRALRADRAIVAGRKGSGKSAIFFQAASEYGRDARNLVLELRPASHNLSELRESLVGVVNIGLFDHTIAAFWLYIVYMELMLKLREALLPKAKFNLTLLNQVQRLEEQFGLTDEIVAGDFTSRLESAIRTVITGLSEIEEGEDVRAKITNILFEGKLPQLRDAVVAFAKDYNAIVLLFDNIDKGWPARQVERHDIATVQHLLEALNKIQRDLRRQLVDFQYLLFLRSDVYETLVEETSDRGKHNLIKIDWSDPEQLEHLIRERVITSVEDSEAQKAWEAVNPVIGGSTAISMMIDSSLRRPRFLIDLCERALSFAINRGHAAVKSEDVEDALDQMSLYLVSDFGYEVRDVSGVSENLFYAFLGRSEILTQDEVKEALNPVCGSFGVNALIDLLLWYGFLGISTNTGGAVFIYDREYDFRRLAAERERQTPDFLYVLNPAFLRGLRG